MNVQRWTRLGRAFMALWVLFALPSAIGILKTGFEPAHVAAAFAYAVWAAIWLWLWLRAIGHDKVAEMVGLVAMTVILSMFALFADVPGGTFLVFSFIVAGVCLPVRQALWAILGLSLLQVGIAVVRLTEPTLAGSNLINSVLVGGLGIGARLFWQSYVQLLAAREQLAQLAVNEERLRFARDLHDLLGQSLAMIVLKSELAAKQLPDGADESLRHEVRDIAQVARKSLNDVREAVAGYRRASLAAEISSARSALRSAGIGFSVEDQLDELAAEPDAVLAWCLREAVTNVVKHSHAARCEVRLTRSNGVVTMRVADDGRGTTSLDGGNGLVGMRERLEVVGGKVDVDSSDGRGLRLQVEIPVG
jgi:two-component system sensor histidine kinase DesK